MISKELRPLNEIIITTYFNTFIGKSEFDVRNNKPTNLFQAQDITFDLDQAMKETLVNVVQIDDPDILMEDNDLSPNEDKMLPKTKRGERKKVQGKTS